MELPCKIVDGLMPAEKIALVADEIGRHEGKILIELPRETASGRWRIWVKESTLKESAVGA